MDQERLKSLTSKREVILAKVKWELSVAKAIKTRNPSLGEVAERRDKLTGLAQCFDDVQTEIEEATPNLEEVVTVFNHRILFEDAYFQIKDIYTEYLDQHVEEPEVRPEDRQDDLRDAVKALLESQQQMLLAQCQKPPPQTLALAAGSHVSNPPS
ncbi:BEL12_AG transposon polyprotein [Culex quinquefasciatus]|uniref:BEL12_AG transposon polyprotein n=1 Tax=Culex quinquefasciatus TaxID=7176 RepID=B0W6P8_CULQU|nr:BEL12_AG transposon polyprotein [Culex quinquefasciatus]|eukprot:XP_001844382.1 BEL12_AG transposon polyprotein [Culex quinquefasciatus]